jgi:cellulose synthase/poly-beta-1,6-N-acetylglucosamine synthase-like glycosyltransferase
MILETLAAALVTVHFAVPLAYYAYLRRVLAKSSKVVQSSYSPNVAVILPTYNEAEIIVERLENLRLQDYPKALMQVLVVDSSRDGTSGIVENWLGTKCDGPRFRLIREEERTGKLHALEVALNQVPQESEIVVFTDADVHWESDALEKVIAYFGDPGIGAVTARITYARTKESSLANIYREYYNTIRVAESKIHSTPVHNGPLLAVRRELLFRIGFPMFVGADDSALASVIAFMGYRAIEADDVTVQEPIRGNQILRSIRRAQHLLLNFLTTKRYAKKNGLYRKSAFDGIWTIEWWLHVINPWLLWTSSAFLVLSVFFWGSILSLALLTIGLAAMTVATFRTWILSQAYLAAACVRNLWTKDIFWNR